MLAATSRLPVVLTLLFAASAAQAATVRELFEKYNLIGTFAIDCSQPVSNRNLYFVNRVLDAGHVQRDQMSGPSTRDYATVIDRATELRPNEIAYGGAREGQPTEGVWRLEPNRQVGVEVTMGGRKVISGTRLVSNGAAVPWLNKCAAR